LLAGRVDAVICSRLVGLYYLKKLNGQDSVSSSGPTVDAVDSFLVFSPKKDYSVLAKQFDHAMETMESDGTLKRIMQNHHLPQAQPTERPGQ
jgi:polar amino acid transport system substrate-binding protein